jgi:hypothetical protein
MIDFGIAILAGSPNGAVKRGAIVSVTQLADIDGKRLPNSIRETAVVDIVFDVLPTFHRFILPEHGTYEVSVRHPGGIEVREVSVGDETEISIQVNPQAAKILTSGSVSTERYPGLGPRIGRYSGWLSGLPTLTTKSFPPDVGPVFNLVGSTAIEMLPPTFHSFRATGLKQQEDNFGGRFGPSNPLVFEGLRYEQSNSVYLDLRGQGHGKETVSRWLSCFRPEGRDLVSVPWNWLPLLEEADREVRIELTSSRSPSGRTLPTRVEVHDSRWGALIEYVAIGRMADAALVADSLLQGDVGPVGRFQGGSLAEWALYGKLKEPMVAVLGGIILVSNVKDGRNERWDRWLRNLAHWFPGIPDAAAIYGYRKLQVGEIDKATEWLRRSVQSGLPFFSATFRLLSLGFSQLEDQEYLARISAAVAAVDATQPFTVIRVPWGSEQ